MELRKRIANAARKSLRSRCGFKNSSDEGLSEGIETLSVQSGSSYLSTTKFQYTWKIYDFSLCSPEIGLDIKSPHFTGGNDNEYTWRLMCFPNGLSDCDQNFISLGVFYESKVNTANAVQVSLEIPGYKRPANRTMVATYLGDFTREVPIPEYANFIAREELYKPENNLLPDDVLTIQCDITIYENPRYKKTKLKAGPYAMELAAGIQETFLRDMSFLFKSKKLSDVTLITCGKEIPAHKVILSARSPVFAAMFDHQMVENQTNKVHFEELDFGIMKQMLFYIYTGHEPAMEKMPDRLLAAADKYQLDGLKNRCELALCRGIRIENASSLFILADLHSAERLKKESLMYIAERLTDILESEDYQTIIKAYPILGDAIIKELSRQMDEKNDKDKRIAKAIFRTRRSSYEQELDEAARQITFRCYMGSKKFRYPQPESKNN